VDVVCWRSRSSLFDHEKEKVNGLYNYPTAPMTLGSFGQLGQQSGLEVTVMGILDGSVLDELKQAQRDYQDYASQLDQAKASIAQMPLGPARTQAEAVERAGEQSLTQQFVSYRQARDTYNNFATQMQAYGFGVYKPALMSGLGRFGQIEPTTAIVLAILAVAALAALASQLSGVISAMHGHEVATKGYIDQLAGMLHELGGLPPAIGAGVKDVAIGAAIFLGVFIIYKLFEKRQSAGSTSVAPAAETQLSGAAA
jgi:hypothetical protein